MVLQPPWYELASQVARHMMPVLLPLGKFSMLLGLGGLMIPTGGANEMDVMDGFTPEMLEAEMGNPQWLFNWAELKPA
jgi:hypothetical protein